jgi:glycosyltransferase involved in cell wall biosynthesis
VDGVEVTAMRVGVYDLYWSTFGGGEQVDGSIAQVLADAGHDVTLLGPRKPDVARLHERLGVDLSGCDFRVAVDDLAASNASSDYDLFVNGTYLSRAVNHAELGYYYVHFPQVPTRTIDRVRNRAYIGAVKAIDSVPADRLPQRLREVQAGFDRRIARTHFIPSYHRFLANSTFTAGWVEHLWGTVADVLYPPVRPSVQPGEKRQLILSLGRFFDPAHGHCKKQLDMLDAFVEMERTGAADGWELALVGGCGPADRDYALAVKRAAVGHRASVHLNAPGSLVEQLLGEASIYWHAAGFGEDPRRHPDRFEHFGISLVEAMAAGAAPVVYGAAGPAEIVRDGVDGDHWRSRSDLIRITTDLIRDPRARADRAEAARQRSTDFAAARFARDLLDLVAADTVPDDTAPADTSAAAP